MSNYNTSPLNITNGRFDQNKFNKLVQIVLRQRIRPHTGRYLVRESAGGTLLDFAVNASQAETILPWTILSTPSTTAGQVNFSVYPGQVNGVIPTNLFSATYTLNQFTVSYTSTTVTYANVNLTSSSNQITSATISFDSFIAPPIPVNESSPVSTFSYCFGMIIGNTTIYRLIGEGNMYFTPTIISRVPVTSPAPNAIPWNDMYTWAPSII